MKIAIFENDTVMQKDVDISILSDLGNAKFYDFSQGQDLVDKIGDSEAILLNKSPLPRETLEKCPNLKYIGLFSTGFNTVDLEYASSRGIVVSNVPDYASNAVVQHVFALILNQFSRVADYSKSVDDGDWIRSKSFCYTHVPTFELSGCTIGIIGFGSIGKKVAEVAKSFGMNVIAYTRTVPENAVGVEFVSLDELISRSDIVTIHCPLTPKTEKLINADTLAKMKPSAMLINTSRGGVIDEQALAYALNNDIIAAAGLDVLTHEPMLAENPLFRAKNCVITPHIAWAPQQTRERLVNLAAENFLAWKNGSPINIVNEKL